MSVPYLFVLSAGRPDKDLVELQNGEYNCSEDLRQCRIKEQAAGHTLSKVHNLHTEESQNDWRIESYGIRDFLGETVFSDQLTKVVASVDVVVPPRNHMQQSDHDEERVDEEHDAREIARFRVHKKYLHNEAQQLNEATLASQSCKVIRLIERLGSELKKEC